MHPTRWAVTFTVLALTAIYDDKPIICIFRIFLRKVIESFFLMQIYIFHFIKTCEKGNIGTRKRLSTKSVSRYKNLLTTQGKNLLAVSHFNIKHFVLWTTPKTLEPQWRNRLKELRIRRVTLKKNRINDINNNNNNNNNNGLLTV